jgi:hypothetical protein
MGASAGVNRLNALDRVPLAARSFELTPEQVRRSALVRDKLLDTSSHPIFHPRDLMADLIDVGLAAAIALALPPQPRMLVAQISH